MGGPGSGRVAKDLTPRQARDLYKGVDLKTADGMRILLERVGKLVARGAASIPLGKFTIELVGAIKGIELETRNDKRVRDALDGIAELKNYAATAGGTAARDVGPPNDDLHRDQRTTSTTPKPDGMTH